MRIDDGGYTYTPPPLVHTDLPPSDTTQHGANTQNVAQPSRDPVPQTPAQIVDLAVARYKAAVASGDQEAIKKAQQDVNTAVRNEIGPQVDAANRGVPPQYRTLTDQQISSYGNVILRRNSADATTQGVLKDAVHDYQIQRQADDLIPQFSGDFTPKEKLDSLKLSLQGQPPEVVARVMQDPSVQRMMQDAVKWISEPYNKSSNPKEDQRAALEASQRLADITADLPPEYAAQVVKQSMPTIQKIAGVDANYSGSQAFTNLSKVVESLGDGADAKALTDQIARAYQQQFNTWEGRFDDPRGGIVRWSVGAGASPKLALAMAEQLKAQGKTDEAGAVLRSVRSGIEALKSKIQQDVKEYNEQTKDLNWLVSNSKGKLTPAQLQKAIDSYIARQPAEWRDKLQEIEATLTEDTKALGADLGELDSVSADLKQAAPDAFQGLGKVVDDETVQKAIQFTANRDPSIFEGERGEKFMNFLTEEAHRSKDFLQSLATAYVAGHVLPAVKDLNALDPASVTKAYKALDDLRAHAATLLGLPQSAVNEDIDKLKELVTTLNTTTSTDEAMDAFKELHGEAKQELSELREMTASGGPAGLAFRVIALGISSAVAINSGAEFFQETDLKTTLGEMASTVGLAQDSVRFADSLKLIDHDGSLAKWAVGGGEKLFGALTAAYFAASTVQDYKEGGAPAVAFDVAGAGGALLATFGEALGLGSWAGPVGWGVTILAAGAVEVIKEGHQLREHTEQAQQFLQGAGLNEETARTLSGDALQEATMVQQQLHLTPDQMQSLAERHPEVFAGGQGATQSVIDVVQANGIQAEDVEGFLDAVAKDDPNYMQVFSANGENKDGVHPLSHAASLFHLVQGMPTAAAFVKAHSPQLVGPDADARRQADSAYEYSDRTPEGVAGLLANNNNPAYQAEIINLMKQNNTLDTFVNAIGTNDHYNGWPEAARSAVQAAVKAGVLTPAQAQGYLAKIG